MSVLVVDDNPLGAEMMRTFLSPRRVVAGATSADEARQVLRGRPFACVVIDVNMPGEGGLDLLRSLRREGVTSPAVMVTALDEESSAEVRAAIAGEGLGPAALLRKPFEPDDLAHLIDTLAPK